MGQAEAMGWWPKQKLYFFSFLTRAKKKPTPGKNVSVGKGLGGYRKKGIDLGISPGVPAGFVAFLFFFFLAQGKKRRTIQDRIGSCALAAARTVINLSLSRWGHVVRSTVK